MSVGPPPQIQDDPSDTVRKDSHRLIEEVARLSEMDLAPAEYFGEFLKRLLAGLSAQAGAVWVRTAQGNLQLQSELNWRQLNIGQGETSQGWHNELLRLAFQQGRPWHLPPRPGDKSLDNPTGYDILFAPIGLDNQVVGLVEVWQEPQGNPGVGYSTREGPAHKPDAPAKDGPSLARQACVWFLGRLAELASLYTRRLQGRQVAGQQQLWVQLETFALQVHHSLDPTEVAYIVANEGRRLTGCDRLSVGLGRGRWVVVEAVSGADVVEGRSNQVKLMRTLFQRVLTWGETLVYQGAPDHSLPAPVLKALDAYLAESGGTLLVVIPLRRHQEGEVPRLPRSALLMECFHPGAAPDQLISRLEVVGRHAASALHNASRYRRIPLHWFWEPLAKIQEGLGGKALAVGLLVAAAVAALVFALAVVPYPLKLDAKGQLLPEERHWIYAPVEGQVVRFEEGLQPGSLISRNQSLVLLYDVQLEIKLVQLSNEIASAQQAIEALARQENGAAGEAEHLRLSAEKEQEEFLRDRKILERKALRERTGADDSRPGNFWLKSPLNGTLLNGDFRENLTNRYVKPSEPLLRIGDKTKPWEIELKIPQQYIGRIVEAFSPHDPAAELDVDLMVLSSPTHVYKGKLARQRIASQANPNREDLGNPTPVVLASVRIDGPDIPETERIPPDLLVTGTEVHTRVRCGNRALGYSLFHGVWEFFNEKVAFFF